MNWKEVVIPDKMQHLDRDVRGLPIPHIVLRDRDNIPQFTVNDTRKVEECVAKSTCAICGQPLGQDTWLVGGPLSAFHPHGAYIDTPIHHECGTYALMVCPYLAMSAYSGHRRDLGKLSDKFDGALFVDPTVIAARPKFFVFGKISGYIRENGYIKPHRPFLALEFWNEGKQISEQQVQQIINEQKFQEDTAGDAPGEA